jgi:hypothetical protein
LGCTFGAGLFRIEFKQSMATSFEGRRVRRRIFVLYTLEIVKVSIVSSVENMSHPENISSTCDDDRTRVVKIRKGNTFDESEL